MNPKAGYKAGMTTNQATEETVRAALLAAGLDGDVALTEGPGHATELARAAAAAGHELVIAAGGDGTVREVVAGLLESETVLGILPLGSAMNLARVLDIPLTVPEAAALLSERGRVEAIDVGRTGDHIFLEAAGVGINAAVVHLLGQVDAGRWRSLRTLLRYLRLARPRRLEITIDDEKPSRYRTLSLLVANSSMSGLNVSIAPGALLNDGLLDVRIFRASSTRALIGQWLRILLRRPLEPIDVYEYTARRVRVRTMRRRPMSVHADDRRTGVTPAVFEVLPGAIRVVVGPGAVLAPAVAGATGQAAAT